MRASSSSTHGSPEASRAESGDAVVGAVQPAIRNVLGSSGQPLDVATRSFFEPRFGSDLSQVRIHTGEEAAESARAIDALAYTSGSEIVFGAGQYSPQTQGGQRLLAHELAHVHQQVGSHTLKNSRGDPTPAELVTDAGRSWCTGRRSRVRGVRARAELPRANRGPRQSRVGAGLRTPPRPTG